MKQTMETNDNVVRVVKMQLIDLSHTITRDGRFMSVFSPKYAPRLSIGVSREESQQLSQLAPDVSYEVTHYSLMGSCGTYLDAPFHFIEQGADLAKLPLQNLVLPGQILDCTEIPPRSGITAEFLTGQEVQPGHAILLRTDFSKY